MASVEIEVKGNGVEVEEKEKKYGEYDDWTIEAAARTLIEAEEIRKDTEKMKYVAQCLKDKGEAYQAALGKIGSLEDLKKAAYKKS